MITELHMESGKWSLKLLLNPEYHRIGHYWTGILNFFLCYRGQYSQGPIMCRATRASLDKHSPPLLPPPTPKTIPATQEAGKKLAEKCETHYFPPEIRSQAALRSKAHVNYRDNAVLNTFW